MKTKVEQSKYESLHKVEVHILENQDKSQLS